MPPLIFFMIVCIYPVVVPINVSDFLAHVSLAALPLNTNDIRNSDTGFTMPHYIKQVSDVICRIIKFQQNIGGDIFVRFGDFWGHDEGFGIHMALKYGIYINLSISPMETDTILLCEG